jgi:hypothetical protein
VDSVAPREAAMAPSETGAILMIAAVLFHCLSIAIDCLGSSDPLQRQMGRTSIPETKHSWVSADSDVSK